jgi:phospholipid/cholesterol/gamma-HCH transport system permease protein
MNTPRSLKRLGASLLIGGQAVTATMRGRINTVELSDQLMEAGPGSLLIVLIISVAAGSVFNIQVAAELTRQGAGSTVGGILALGLAREIAPLLTACLLAGKVATAYAAQLGTMKVTEQIDAITMLRTDPVEYLVVPRLIAFGGDGTTAVLFLFHRGDLVGADHQHRALQHPAERVLDIRAHLDASRRPALHACERLWCLD